MTGLTDVVAAEWIRLRSVRSTYYLLGAVAVALAVGMVVALLMTQDWDGLPPERKQRMESADVATIATPFTQFCVAVLAGLAVTGEYTTGMIRTTLTTVPRRGLLLAGRSLVVGGVTLVAGLVSAFLALLATWLVVGDRPQPIAPWDDVADGAVPALTTGINTMVVALVALGIGAVVRSSAGTLVTMTALLFVLPGVALLLPGPWNGRVFAVLPINLGPQLAGGGMIPLLSPTGAAAVMAGYVVLALGAGAALLRRRDA